MIGRLCCLGPGRLGSALARRWREAGIDLCGFFGRDAERVADAAQFCGAVPVLTSYADLSTADAVLISVSDAALPEVVAAVVDESSPKQGSYWFHCSGYHGLDVLEPLAKCGARTGSIHPLCPAADRLAGYHALAGSVALIEAAPQDVVALADLARRAGLEPIAAPPGVDRRLYHAACSMGANGVTALREQLAGLLAKATGLSHGEIDPMLDSLMLGALRACSEVGAVAALSGPIPRGDRTVVRGHLEALGEGPAADSYRLLMRCVVDLAIKQGGIDEHRGDALRRLLQDHPGSGCG